MPLKFNLEDCTGCKLCQLACSAGHEGVFNPMKARLKITHEYRGDNIHIKSTSCTFCKIGEKVCPENAISNNGKWMIVNNDRCTGRGICADKCPTGVLYLTSEKKPIICDLCEGEPKCIEWCPKNVISLR